MFAEELRGSREVVFGPLLDLLARYGVDLRNEFFREGVYERLTEGTGETKLTVRQIEVLEGVAVEKTNRQIAADMNVTIDTVRTHLVQTKRKMNNAGVLPYEIDNLDSGKMRKTSMVMAYIAAYLGLVKVEVDRFQVAVFVNQVSRSLGGVLPLDSGGADWQNGMR